MQGSNEIKPIYQQAAMMSTQKDNNFTCYKCGIKGHKANNCKKTNLHCTKCKRNGHVDSVCRSNMGKIHSTDVTLVDGTDIKEFEVYNNFYSMGNSDKIFIKFCIEGKFMSFEFDTGSAITTINETIFKLKFPNSRLNPSRIQIRVYNKETLPIIGEAVVKVSFKGIHKHLPIYVVPSGLDSICGRNWINAFKLLPIPTINSIEERSSKETLNLTERITSEFKEVFEEKIGNIPEIKAEYKLREDAKPIYIKPRPVPYAIKMLLEEEIQRLEKNGIFEKVNESDWGTPVVPVLKSPTQVRLCADYKVALNQNIINDKYPIPKIEDLYHRLRGGIFFCVLDIHKAYLHLTMSEESALMQTVSTHLGLFKVNKLMFGVKNAPNIWQRFMDTKVVRELEGVACFFDDIIISGITLEETEDRLRIILQRLQNLNLHCGLKKCKFFQKSVTYLGHTIDCEGLHKTMEKVEAILKVGKLLQ